MNDTATSTNDLFFDVLSVKLDQFEGPLDLLLHLVKQAKIDIKDIFVSQVTQQFLVYMSQIDTIDIDRASEFMETAATLVEIKSRSLLPKLEDLMPNQDEEDPELKLQRQLEEYKLFKEASDKLKDIENNNRFYKQPDDSAFDVKLVLNDAKLDNLLDAFSKLLHKVSKKKDDVVNPKLIKKDLFTVADKIKHIQNIVAERKTVSFFELFDNDYSVSELIVTFCALLELLRLQFVGANQCGVYNDITIYLKNTGESDEQVV